MRKAAIITTILAATALWAGMAHAIGAVQLPRTGQGEAGTCWNSGGTSVPCAGTGQDGEKRKGVALPSPRFTDNGNGTVTDNLTGLIWLKDANCWSTGRNWAPALSLVNALANGQCGLTDGSTAGQWHLPSFKELESLVDLNQTSPALTAGHPFINVRTGTTSGDSYWTSTTVPSNTGCAFAIVMGNGVIYNQYQKSSYAYFTWAVR